MKAFSDEGFFVLGCGATMKGLLQVYPERSRRALLYVR